jgi:hypothetical protein
MPAVRFAKQIVLAGDSAIAKHPSGTVATTLDHGVEQKSDSCESLLIYISFARKIVM